MDVNSLNQDADEKPESYWMKTCPHTNFPVIQGDLKVDTVIVGGGIGGITTGALLNASGHDVAIIESDRIVKEVTAGTTAKISVAPNLIYSRLLKNLGLDKTRLYAEANINALDKIGEIVSERKIECEFQRTPLYIYTESEKNVERLKKEYEAVKRLGLQVNFMDDTPLPFKTGPALLYKNQAQFHPRKYLLGLSEDLHSRGVKIFEKTRVNDVKTGEVNEVITDTGSVFADNVVISTNKPVYDPDGLKDHLHYERSYVIGFYIQDEFPEGMFIDFDPVHTYRTTPTNNGKLIIVAGEHSALEVDDKNKYYKRLENYAREHLDVESVEYKWTSYDGVSDDGLPIIGMTSQRGVYVATGFGFWGMSNGTTSAMVISDLINRKKTAKENIFNPRRFK